MPATPPMTRSKATVRSSLAASGRRGSFLPSLGQAFHCGQELDYLHGLPFGVARVVDYEYERHAVDQVVPEPTAERRGLHLGGVPLRPQVPVLDEPLRRLLADEEHGGVLPFRGVNHEPSKAVP